MSLTMRPILYYIQVLQTIKRGIVVKNMKSISPPFDNLAIAIVLAIEYN